MATYRKGQSVKLSVAFTDAAGAPADPSIVVCTVEAPDGTEASYTTGTTPAITNPSTGAFHLILTATQSGRWSYRWEGTTGTSVAVDEGRFTVLLSHFE